MIASAGIWAARKAIDPQVSVRNFLALIHRGEGAPSPRSIPEIFAAAETSQARWLHANPPIIRRCLDFIESNHRRLPPSVQFVESSGSWLGNELKDAFQKITGARIVDQYGCREVWVIGYGAAAGLFGPGPDHVVVELVDDSGRPVEDTGIPGRVVVTSLCQKVFPFVRYDTGDIARWIDLAGERLLALDRHRPSHVILGISPTIFGSDVFKRILIDVYRSIGYPKLNYIQIRQMEDREFQLVVERSAPAGVMREEIEQRYNRSIGAASPAAFTILEIDPSKVSNSDKLDLFTNRHHRMRGGSSNGGAS